VYLCVLHENTQERWSKKGISEKRARKPGSPDFGLFKKVDLTPANTDYYTHYLSFFSISQRTQMCTCVYCMKTHKGGVRSKKEIPERREGSRTDFGFFKKVHLNLLIQIILLFI